MVCPSFLVKEITPSVVLGSVIQTGWDRRTHRRRESVQRRIGSIDVTDPALLHSCRIRTGRLAGVPVDVVTEITIARPRLEVAGYAANPDNATAWYENIEQVDWPEAERPLAVGSTMAFVAAFLGRKLSYTYEVREHDPGRKLVMSTADGPFPMETTYAWEDADAGTRMTLRNRGEPSGFSKVAGPMMAAAMRRANRKDLARLKAILEAQT
jgi:Polyketide cyclase / dehydrase and lipid transport